MSQVGWKPRVAALAVVALAIFGVWWFAIRGDDGPEAVGDVNLGPLVDGEAVVGEPAPDFVLQTPEGGLVRLSDFRGKVVLVNFWASWCGPCRQEMPEFQTQWELHGDRFVVLAVNVEDTLSGARGFIEEFGLTFPVGVASSGVSKEMMDAYGVRGLPKSFFVDEQGVLRDLTTGGITRDQLLEKLAELGVS